MTSLVVILYHQEILKNPCFSHVYISVAHFILTEGYTVHRNAKNLAVSSPRGKRIWWSSDAVALNMYEGLSLYVLLSKHVAMVSRWDVNGSCPALHLFQPTSYIVVHVLRMTQPGESTHLGFLLCRRTCYQTQISSLKGRVQFSG